MTLSTRLSVGDTFYYIDYKWKHTRKMCVDCGGTGEVISKDPDAKYPHRKCPHCIGMGYNDHDDGYEWVVASLKNGDPITEIVKGVDTYSWV